MAIRFSGVGRIRFIPRSAPGWLNTLVTSYNVSVGDTLSVDLDDFTTGAPDPDVTIKSGSVPGISLDADTHQFSGQFSTAGEYTVVFNASNSEGDADSPTIRFKVGLTFRGWLVGSKVWKVGSKIWGSESTS